MIAKLNGLVDELGDDHVVIDVGGVGYLVYCSARTLAAMPARGQAVSLQVETHVREDHIHLYGFLHAAERQWFKLLTTVQGVGSRVGLAILSVLSADSLAQALAAQDKAALTRAEGVGPRLATRIVAELKEKAGIPALGVAARGDSPAMVEADQVTGDAISALVNLGYGHTEAFSAVMRVSHRDGAPASVEALIPAALKELGGGVAQ
ncbi:MAG: Holliday junction branch migration protein RuvA [Alphaproteobacteria bacterium]